MYSAKVYDMLRQCSLGKHKYISILFRSISLYPLNYSKYGQREARFMKKIMGNANTGKRKWYNFQEGVPVPSFPSSITSATGSQNHRRITVLNKVFMRYISEMMASGELSDMIVGRGLEISRVKMAPDFNRINVFWLANESQNDAEIEEMLEKYSWKLRHELSQLRVIGIVPPLYFVKDKQYSKTVEVNRILATADFGEDYVPLDVGYCFKSEFAQTSYLPPQKSEEEQQEGVYEPSLPPMRNDVLGLRHADIMTKIKRGMKKAKALHRQDISEENANTELESIDPIDTAVHANINLKREEFTKFLMKQQIQRKKMQRMKKNYTPEMEMHETEALENSSVATEFMDSIDRDKDYIEEIEDRRLK